MELDTCLQTMTYWRSNFCLQNTAFLLADHSGNVPTTSLFTWCITFPWSPGNRCRYWSRMVCMSLKGHLILKDVFEGFQLYPGMKDLETVCINSSSYLICWLSKYVSIPYLTTKLLTCLLDHLFSFLGYSTLLFGIKKLS